MSLSVVEPIALTDANLIASNVPETDYAAWSAGTTYALGDRVIRTTTHKIYESLQASNTGWVPETNPTRWVEVSATNRWKAWDTASSTQTTNSGTITYQIVAASSATAIGFVNLQAITVRVQVVSPAGVTVADSTVDAATVLSVSDWWSYFFEPVVYRRELVFDDLFVDAGSTVSITLDAGADTAAVGAIIVGRSTTIGEGIQYGATTGILDYSIKVRNDFGDTVLRQRAYARRAEFLMWVGNDVADAIEYRLSELRSVPALWVGTSIHGYGRTIVYGFYKDFEMRIKYPTYTELAISIEGLT